MSSQSKNDLFNRKVCELGADNDQIAMQVRKENQIGSQTTRSGGTGWTIRP
jgi:hypothetical protein